MRIANPALGLPSDCRRNGIDDKGGHAEAKVVRDKKPQSRPKCGKGNAVVHGRVKRPVYHTPVKSKPCILVIDLRRYRCKRRGNTLFEPLSTVSGASPHATADLDARMVGQVRLCRSFSETARGCGASADIVRKVVDAPPPPKRRLPRRLCVDEFHAFGKRGAHEGQAERFWTVFADGDSGRLVDVIERRDKAAVEGWLRKFPKGERLSVGVFTCDMSGAFWRAAKAQLPGATVCLDKFHIVALAKNAFEDAGRRASKRPGKSAADAKRIWKLLVADRARLRRAPRARLMLQLFYERAAADFADDRERREAPSSWAGRAEGCGVREVAKAARSVREVKALVADAYMTDRTNAYAGNANRKIEDVKRRSCGFTKRENMRRRLLLALGFPSLEKGGVPRPNRNE